LTRGRGAVTVVVTAMEEGMRQIIWSVVFPFVTTDHDDLGGGLLKSTRSARFFDWLCNR
jgi:hypothetical protein